MGVNGPNKDNKSVRTKKFPSLGPFKRTGIFFVNVFTSHWCILNLIALKQFKLCYLVIFCLLFCKDLHAHTHAREHEHTELLFISFQGVHMNLHLFQINRRYFIA